MSSEPIRAIYVGLTVRPYRFVVHRRSSPDVDVYERHAPNGLRVLLFSLFDVLADGKPEFMSALASLDDREFMQTRQERRFVADNRDHLYINSPRLADKHVARYGEFWIATNIGHKEANRIAGLACEAARVSRLSMSKLRL